MAGLSTIPRSQVLGCAVSSTVAVDGGSPTAPGSSGGSGWWKASPVTSRRCAQIASGAGPIVRAGTASPRARARARTAINHCGSGKCTSSSAMVTDLWSSIFQTSHGSPASSTWTQGSIAPAAP